MYMCFNIKQLLDVEMPWKERHVDQWQAIFRRYAVGYKCQCNGHVCRLFSFLSFDAWCAADGPVKVPDRAKIDIACFTFFVLYPMDE